MRTRLIHHRWLLEMGHRQNTRYSSEPIQEPSVDRGVLRLATGSRVHTIIPDATPMGCIILDQFLAGEKPEEIDSVVDGNIQDRFVPFQAMLHSLDTIVNGL